MGNKMMARLAALSMALACVVPMTSYAQEQRLAGTSRTFISGVYASDDSEGFQTYRAMLGFEPWRFGTAGRAGIAYRQHYFEQDNWSRDGQQLALIAEQKQKDGTGWKAEAGYFVQGGDRILTTDANLVSRLGDATLVEVFVNRDVVETRQALDAGVHFTMAGAAVEHMLTQKFTVVGLAAHQRFSDDNRRNHGRLRLIYQPYADLGLTLQLRLRAFEGDPSSAPRTFFNPEQYRETMAAIGWRKRYAGWITAATGGLGRQRIDGNGSTPTRLAEVSAESPEWRLARLAFRAGYSRSAAFGGPDYRYGYLRADVSVPF